MERDDKANTNKHGGPQGLKKNATHLFYILNPGSI